MLWRNRPEVFFAEQHAREPGGVERVQTDLYCQHYGKSLSVEHWEETCDYYIRHFPFETTDENGVIAKVAQSIPNLILCGLSTNGVTCSLRTRSRFDEERARPWALVDGSGRYGTTRPPCSAGLVSWTTNEQSLGRSHLLSSSGRQAQGEERG